MHSMFCSVQPPRSMKAVCVGQREQAARQTGRERAVKTFDQVLVGRLWGSRCRRSGQRGLSVGGGHHVPVDQPLVGPGGYGQGTAGDHVDAPKKSAG